MLYVHPNGEYEFIILPGEIGLNALFISNCYIQYIISLVTCDHTTSVGRPVQIGTLCYTLQFAVCDLLKLL